MIQARGTRHDLTVPTWMRRDLDVAVETGTAWSRAWGSTNPDGDRRAFNRAARATVPAPPTASLPEELRRMHDARRARTDADTSLARRFARDAGWFRWEPVVGAIGRDHGQVAAARAVELLEETKRRAVAVVTSAKRAYQRTRPYDEDPTIDPVVTIPKGRTSYPSAHTSAAYAAALVLASFLPSRRAELLDVAAQVAWSRVYGGVHYPSDVVEGARIAAAVSVDVLRRGGRSETGSAFVPALLDAA